jgi:hypothetical protein
MRLAEPRELGMLPVDQGALFDGVPIYSTPEGRRGLGLLTTCAGDARRNVGSVGKRQNAATVVHQSQETSCRYVWCERSGRPSARTAPSTVAASNPRRCGHRPGRAAGPGRDRHAHHDLPTAIESKRAPGDHVRLWTNLGVRGQGRTDDAVDRRVDARADGVPVALARRGRGRGSAEAWLSSTLSPTASRWSFSPIRIPPTRSTTTPTSEGPTTSTAPRCPRTCRTTPPSRC